MRITVFGAAGNVGSRVVAEAVSRGHEVSAVVRDPARFPELDAAANARAGDAGNVEGVAELSAGRDVVINATRPAPGREGELVTTTKALLAGGDQLEACRAEAGVDWAYLSPAALLEPGERTGNYRLGTDELLVDADGNSTISMEDLAVALLDETERPKHRRTRFTAAY
ncbi:MAG: NAD(P)-dependent oxidoreductase [Pseudonocardiaceae bacterium]